MERLAGCRKRGCDLTILLYLPTTCLLSQGRQIASKDRLKIGIVGFGNFGKFLARRFARHGHELTAWSRTDYSKDAHQMGVKYFR